MYGAVLRVIWVLALVASLVLCAICLRTATTTTAEQAWRDELWRGAACFGVLASLSAIGAWRLLGPIVLLPVIAAIASIVMRTVDPPAEQLVVFCIVGFAMGVAVDFFFPRPKSAE